MKRIVTGLVAVALAAGLAACSGGHPTPVHAKYESLLTWLNNAPRRLPPGAVLPGGAALVNESYGVDLNGRYTLRTDTTLSTPLSFMCISDSKEGVSLGVRASDRDTTVVYGQLNCVGEIGRIHIGQKKTDVRAPDDNPVMKAVAAQIGSLPGSNSPVTGRFLTEVRAAARATWMGPTGHGAHSPSVTYQSVLRWSVHAASTDLIRPANGATRRYDDTYHAKPNGRYALRATRLTYLLL